MTKNVKPFHNSYVASGNTHYIANKTIGYPSYKISLINSRIFVYRIKTETVFVYEELVNIAGTARDENLVQVGNT